MNRTILLKISVLIAVALAPLAAGAQVNPDADQAPVQAAPYKYEAFAGFAYSRIRQVPLANTYSGLLGGKLQLARNWGKYFQLVGSADYYQIGTGHAGVQNPSSPTAFSVLAGPGIHASYENLGGQLFTELGLEHTGGENMSPSYSFAGGIGGSLSYSINRRWAVELTGDRLGASFPLPNNAPTGTSTHRTWNVRGAFGVVYRF